MLLLHISDIHFRKGISDTKNDPDLTLRELLVRDAELQKAELGPVDRIIVGGDIAYGGHPDEYEMADVWLEKLRKASGCPDGGILVVPGNHDVDRNITKDDVNVANAQRAVHRAKDKHAELRRQLGFDATAKEFVKPITAYNIFARQYDCQIYGLEKIAWEHLIPIDENVSLLLHGLTTTYLSQINGENDGQGHNLYVSPLQLQLFAPTGVVNGVLCHHPPDWLTDQDDVDEAICNRAVMHFFGHKHRQRITREHDYIRFAAAAVNPEPGDKWEPGYNLIRVNSSKAGKDLTLHFECHLRIWQSNPNRFVAKQDTDNTYVFKHSITFRDFNFAKKPHSLAEPKGNETEVSKSIDEPNNELKKGSLVLRFWHLSSSDRREIAEELGLLREGEMELDETVRYGRVLDRVYEENLLESLRTAIQGRE